MEELALQHPELIGREEELTKLRQSLDNAIAGKGSAIFVSGEAGIGKTRLVSELIKEAEAKDARIIQGWCLAESLEPLMPIKAALRETEIFHLITGAPPPLIVSAYLMNEAGMLLAKAEQEQLEIDADLFAGMLKAVGDFVKDSLSMMGKEGGSGLNSLGYEKYKILIQTLGKVSLATVIEGSESEFLIDDMKATLAELGGKFDDWSGDVTEVAGIQPMLSWYIDSGKYDGRFLVDDPRIKQENLFDNILLGVQRLSRDKTLLLFLDDLQWADPSTLNLLHYLARNTKDDNVLLLGTFRPEEILDTQEGKAHQLEMSMQIMNRENLLERIELNRMGLEDTGRIIESALGWKSFEGSFYQKIFKDTGGTPFFILEVVKLLVEERCIEPDDEGTWKLVADPEKLDIPSKVYDVVKRRLDRLMKEQREILECASVVGEEFQSEMVGKIAGIDRIRLLKSLSEIEKTHRLIHSLEKMYIFDHSKVREVLYNGIIDELKQEYHKIVADTMVELHPENLDEYYNEVAHHYYKAGDHRAGEFLVKAGDQAKERYANEEAIKQYENAVESLPGEEKKEILEILADLQTLVGEFDGALGNLKKASDYVTDDEGKARLLRKHGVVYEKRGEREKSIEVLTEAMELLQDEVTAELGRILVSRGNIHYRNGDFDAAMPKYLDAMKVFERSESEARDVGNVLRAIGNIHLSKGEYDDALRLYDECLNKVEEAEDPHWIATLFSNIGIVYVYKGELQKSLDYYGKSLELLRKVGFKSSLSVSLNNIGGVYYSLGDMEKALDYFDQSLEIREKIGDVAGISSSLGNLAGVYLSLGELDRAMEYNERCLRIKEDIGDSVGVALALNNIADLNTAMGKLDKAREIHERTLEIYSDIGDKRGTVNSLCGLTEVLLEMGDLRTALVQIENAVEIATEMNASKLEGATHRVLGMVYGAMEELDRAEEEFQKAWENLGDAEDKKELARLLYEHALLYKVRSEAAPAKENLEKALSMFEEMGMKLWEEKCRKALECSSV